MSADHEWKRATRGEWLVAFALIAAGMAILALAVGEIRVKGGNLDEQTIREELPEGFQRSEYLLEHGMLDMLCHRDTLRPTVAKLLAILMPVPLQ